ncbi:MAG: lysophospholipid acyltransferase family protein [Gammaproteobacteria bacterium]|nr:lysophospholipid acyltransferase family protein [Gammaproteobacteria bacterium]
MTAVRWLGSIVFTTLLFVTAALWGIVTTILGAISYRLVYGAVVAWAHAMLWLLRVFCGIDHRVRGLEHLPDEASVILMKHSSTWETLAQLCLFPQQTWVMKRELMWAPIMGWTLYFLKAIPINRKGGRAAVEQVLAHGCRHLDEGRWVVIFPEGTRMPAGTTRRYGLSGVLLAQAAGRKIVPVAHNAGEYWPRRATLKRPGTIHVVIGAPIDPAGREPRELNQQIQDWVEAEIAAMAPQSDRGSE